MTHIIICSCILIQGEITKYTWGKKWIVGVNVEITISDFFYKVFINIYLSSEGQIILPPTVIVGLVVTEGSRSVV
jgi:hypothetical protein